jgi:hypothetical protein
MYGRPRLNIIVYGLVMQHVIYMDDAFFPQYATLFVSGPSHIPYAGIGNQDNSSSYLYPLAIYLYLCLENMRLIIFVHIRWSYTLLYLHPKRVNDHRRRGLRQLMMCMHESRIVKPANLFEYRHLEYTLSVSVSPVTIRLPERRRPTPPSRRARGP